MNEERLIEFRRDDDGRIEYRQRRLVYGDVRDQVLKLIVSRDWGAWEPIPDDEGPKVVIR